MFAIVWDRLKHFLTARCHRLRCRRSPAQLPDDLYYAAVYLMIPPPHNIIFTEQDDNDDIPDDLPDLVDVESDVYWFDIDDDVQESPSA